MKRFDNPIREKWNELIQRPSFDPNALQELVKTVLQDVKDNGDVAVRKYTEQFDAVTLTDTRVVASELEEAATVLTTELKQAIQLAYNNIRVFHEQQLFAVEKIETMPGVQCWRRSVGIEKVGLYIPGGSAPLFSTILMLGIPAKLAGCKEIILCSPPDKNGKLHPAILYAAGLVGVTAIYKIGGVQAIAAMAYGT